MRLNGHADKSNNSIFPWLQRTQTSWSIVSRGDWLWKSASFKERCLCYDFCIVTWSRKCTQNHRSSTLVVISALFVSFLRVFKHYILIILQEICIYVMPGVNCSVFGCGSCRRTKGMGIWKLPLAKDATNYARSNFCFSGKSFLLPFDNLNYALSGWKVRHIEITLTNMYSLSLLFCQSGLNTVCQHYGVSYQALTCTLPHAFISHPISSNPVICFDLPITRTPANSSFFDSPYEKVPVIGSQPYFNPFKRVSSSLVATSFDFSPVNWTAWRDFKWNEWLVESEMMNSQLCS